MLFLRCQRADSLSRVLALICFVLYTASALAQTAPVIGLHENTPRVVALVNARVVVAPGRVLEEATLVIRDSRIEAVGPGISVPPDAVKRDFRGLTLYPGFIDLFTDYGIAGSPAPGAGTMKGKAGARHWNPAVRPETRAAELFRPDGKKASALRRAGFTAVVSYPQGGIFRGAGALILPADTGDINVLLAEDVAQAFSFNKGEGLISGGVDGYPGSLMGHVALIRQTFLDAEWYRTSWSAYKKAPAGQTAPEINLSLSALEPYLKAGKPLILDADYEFDILRAQELSHEFGLDIRVLGTGSEYRRLDDIKASALKVILPLNFPDPPDVSTVPKELDVTLRELRQWDFAPENPGRAARAGIIFALSSARLDDPEKFLRNLRRAVVRGLDPQAALTALTTTPAGWLGYPGLSGMIEKGRLANLVVTDGDIFREKTKIIETWVAGKPFEINPLPLAEVRGRWQIKISGKIELEGILEIGGEQAALSADLILGGKKIKVQKAALEKRLLSLLFPGDSLGIPGIARLLGTVQADTLSGRGRWGDNSPILWQAVNRERKAAEPDTLKKEPEKMASFEVVYPEGAFGRSELPVQPEEVLVKDATIWTCAESGVLEKDDLLVRKGKIAAVGRNLYASPGAEVIDARGKHISPGIIDAHSHIAIMGNVNEGTQAVTSEVRIEDVLDPDDINIYRQLAGGVTSALLIHGSANPVGGQAALIKLRWGASPRELLLNSGWPVIKFALGENVTLAYSPQRPDSRYPSSRLGVEQLFRDWFDAAKDYRRRWEIYNAGREKNPQLISPRKDLRLEALLEVLNGKRQVHCHSYRQDEILAMIRVAEEFGFKVRVLIHVLEGYKVAEILREHGAMPTTFSDWWAYKIEVYDAIPYNGALMYGQGLVVSFNSDDQELARRLNLEAAKAVKYGKVPPEEALKFVTLNPARQLGVENRTGSLAVGKDADFVIWSGSPLSSFSKCEETWIDGRRYFSLDEDRELRRASENQRKTLVQKILALGASK